MIRETKQRIVRTIETEVHDREDSLPLSKNQRNNSTGTDLKAGETKRLSAVSLNDPAVYLSRKEEKEWNCLSLHARKKFQVWKSSGQYQQREGELLQDNSLKGAESRRGEKVKKTSWYLEGNRFSATEKRKWQAWREDRDIQGKTVRKKQQVAESRQQPIEGLSGKILPSKFGSQGGQKGITQTMQGTVKVSGEGMKVAVSGAESSHPAGLAVKTARKTADAFRQYLKQMNEAVQESVARQQTSDNEMEEGLKGAVHTLTMTVMSLATMGVSMFLNALVSLTAMLASSFVVIFGAIIIVCAVAVILFSTIAGTESQPATGHGLPPFVTEDMMQAFFETQEKNGVPVSTGIAQLIAESGFGTYGPGGEKGQGLSSLAYEYKNL